VRRRLTVLATGDVHRGGPEVDSVPGQIAQLGSPQGMPIGHDDHRRVAVAVAIGFSRLDQLLDLAFG